MTSSPQSLLSALQVELMSRELSRRSLLNLIQRFHPDYKPGWSHKKLADTLDAVIEAIARKGSPRVIVTVPPRWGKSTQVSEFLPTYALGHHPDWEVVCATYGQDLADQFGRRVREHLNNPLYQETFPTRIDPRANAADFVATTKRGSYTAVGVGGALTGKGAHLLIIDDPIRNREDADSETMREKAWDWYTSVARTRLHPGGGIIVVATRWHVDDLIGRLIEQAKGNPSADQWTVIEMPAIATEDEEFRRRGEAIHPERYPVSELLRTKASLPARDWEALYQCSPFVAEGAFFKATYFNKTYKTLPSDVSWYVSGDYATSSKKSADYSAIFAVGIDPESNIYIHPKRYWLKTDIHDATEKTLDLMREVKSDVLIIEKGGLNNALRPQFNMRMRERRQYITFAEISRTQKKHIYALPLQARMEMGTVYFPDAPWVQSDLVPEFLRFMPESDNVHDDQVDALSQAAFYLDKMPAPIAYKPKEDPDAWREEGEIYGEDLKFSGRNAKSRYRGLYGQEYK